jgi:hypothetical protein
MASLNGTQERRLAGSRREQLALPRVVGKGSWLLSKMSSGMAQVSEVTLASREMTRGLAHPCRICGASLLLVGTWIIVALRLKGRHAGASHR